MESKKELNKKIVAITIEIQENFPELMKCLNEIPQHSRYVTHKGIDVIDLKDYLETLSKLLETHSQLPAGQEKKA